MKNSFADVKLKFLNLENILPHFSLTNGKPVQSTTY